MTNIDLKTVEKSLTYSEFRSFVSNALVNDPSSLNIADNYLPYAEINETRLKRLDKTLKIEEHVIAFFNQLKEEYVWMVISESWCGDAAQSVPVLNKLAELSDKIELKVVFRDENLELMDAFLTNGGRAIPKLIIAKKSDLSILGDWGPRPKSGQKIIDDYKGAHGTVNEEAKVALQMWYTKDKGHEIANEVMEIMAQIEA